MTGEHVKRSDPHQQTTGKELLNLLIGKQSQSARFVQGISDAARLQYVRTRADGRKEILTKALYGIDYDPTGVIDLVASALGEDLYYQNLRATEKQIEMDTRVAGRNADPEYAEYYSGFHKAQSVLARYVSEDRSALLKEGKSIASVYEMFLKGTIRFIADFSEMTGVEVL